MYDHRHIGAKVPLAVKALPPSAFDQPEVLEAPRWPHTSNALSWSKEFAQFASFRYGLPLPRFSIAFAPLAGHAGHVVDQLHHCNITIDSQFQTDTVVLAHVLAHELAHLLLNRAGIRLAEDEANELLTDSVAVLAGFGPIMIAGKERSKTHWHLSGVTISKTVSTTRVGYLAEAEIAWLMNVRRHLGTGFPWPRRSVNRRRRESCTCPVCGTKLLLPDLDATIDLRCPECTLRQRILLRSGSLIRVAFRRFWQKIRHAGPAV